MPITPPGQDTGQALGDLFGNVNRPQLNAFVATSQARNGLVSAQTQDALIKAQQAQEEMEARDRLHSELVAGGMKPSEASIGTDVMKGHFGDFTTALKGLAMLRLGNPNSTPEEQVRAQQMHEGKFAGPVTAPDNYMMPPGSPLANVPVQQSPEGAAKTGAQTALAGLHANQAAHPELFHPGGPKTLDPVLAQEAAQFIKLNPNLAGNFRSLLSNGGPDVIHAFLHPEGAAPSAPPNGVSPAPGVSLKEQADIRKDFANGLGARQATALNTMVQHSQLFDAVADQLGNGNFAPTNYINQLWQRTFGSPAPTNLQIAGSFLGREAVRATVNSGAGTGEERELAVNASSSPDALHGAAATLRSLAASQLHSLDIRAQRGGVDIAQLLGPEAQAAFGRRPVAVQTPPEGAAPPPAAAAAPPLGSQLPNAPAAGGAVSLDEYLKKQGF